MKGDGKARERADGALEAYLPHLDGENFDSYLHMLPSGDLLAIWASGPRTQAADRRGQGSSFVDGVNGASATPRGLVVSYLRKGESEWTKPKPLAFHEEFQYTNPVVINTDHGGKELVLLFQTRKLSRPDTVFAENAASYKGKENHGKGCYDLWEMIYPEQTLKPNGQSCYWKANTKEACARYYNTCAKTCGLCVDDEFAMRALRSHDGGENWEAVDDKVHTPTTHANLRHDPIYVHNPACRNQHASHGRPRGHRRRAGAAGCAETSYLLPVHFDWVLPCSAKLPDRSRGEKDGDGFYDKVHATAHTCVAGQPALGPAVASHLGLARATGDGVLRGADWSLMQSPDVNAFAMWDEKHSWTEAINDGHGNIEYSNTSWWKNNEEPSMRQLPEGYAEPCIMRGRDGRLVALMRARGGGLMLRTESLDEGLSWSFPLETGITSQNEDFSCAFLPNGNFVVVFNNLSNRRIPRAECLKTFKDECPGLGSPPLSVAISSDMGVTWPYVKDLQYQFEGSEYSFPSVTADADGFIHLIFSWSACRACVPALPYHLAGYKDYGNKGCYMTCRKLSQGIRSMIKYMVFNENWIVTPYDINAGTVYTYGFFKGDIKARKHFSQTSGKAAAGAKGWWEASEEGTADVEGNGTMPADAGPRVHDGVDGSKTIVPQYSPPPVPAEEGPPPLPPEYTGWAGAVKVGE